MMFFFPVLILGLTALAIMLLGWLALRFRYFWLIALGGSIIAVIGVILWRTLIPRLILLPPWMPSHLFEYAPGWQIDTLSWPYAFLLSITATATLLTAAARNENQPRLWAAILTLTGVGLLAISAQDMITLLLTWSVLDLTELAILLRSGRRNGKIHPAVRVYAAQTAGLGSVMVATVLQTRQGLPLTFETAYSSSALFLLLGIGLRMGILLFHLPYPRDNTARRGLGTMLRLIAAAATLAFLGRLPSGISEQGWALILSFPITFFAVYSGWMWLRASDEIAGRPFWVVGLASLAILSVLRGSPSEGMGWGIALLAGGALLFLYSSRARSLRWLVLTGLWGLSALPFSPTAISLPGNETLRWFTWPMALLTQALLMTGFIRHTLHPGETSFESQTRSNQILYVAGLFLPFLSLFALGLLRESTAQALERWPWGIVAIGLTLGLWWLLQSKLKNSLLPSSRQEATVWWNWPIRAGQSFIHLLEQLAAMIVFLLEGEGGLLWAILFSVILLSLTIQGGP